MEALLKAHELDQKRLSYASSIGPTSSPIIMTQSPLSGELQLDEEIFERPMRTARDAASSPTNSPSQRASRFQLPSPSLDAQLPGETAPSHQTGQPDTSSPRTGRRHQPSDIMRLCIRSDSLALTTSDTTLMGNLGEPSIFPLPEADNEQRRLVLGQTSP